MGIVFDIQRCCTHDGPGIRTTVFLKGCPLRCPWCHNPESFRLEPQTVLRSGVPTVIGREISVSAVMDTVRRDRIYYEESGGGVTFSGGEPTLQKDFLLQLLTACRAEGFHTALETNGFLPADTLDALLPLVDLFLLDYKLEDPSSLLPPSALSPGDLVFLWQRTLDSLQAAGKDVILRLPIIPGVNDTPEHFEAAARICRTHPCIRKAEILPYHDLGVSKWEELGLAAPLGKLPSATPEQKAEWEAQLAHCLEAFPQEQAV